MAPRNPFASREVTSRRGGRVKHPLSRDIIVRAALDLLIREGAEGMSLRKVAASLDTGPATLYAYVDDLVELQALVLDRALGGVDVVGNPAFDWRQRLRALLASYLMVLSRTPGLAMLAMNTIAAGPNALAILEALLGILEEAGVDKPTAAWSVDLLTLYVTALATELAQRSRNGDPMRPLAQAIGNVSAKDHPRFFAVRELLMSGDGPERFAWAIDVLVNGILQTSEARAAKRPRR